MVRFPRLLLYSLVQEPEMTVNFQVPKPIVQSSHIAAASAMVKEVILRVFLLLLPGLMAICTLYSVPAKAIDLPDFKRLVAEEGRAVVKVTVVANEVTREPNNSLPNFNEDGMPEFFQRFFEDLPRSPGVPPGEGEADGFGSGFVLSEDGYIVTNAHVVKNAQSILVSFPDRRQFDATLVGADERTDVAVLKIEGSNFPVLTLGDSSALKVGQWVLAIGSPFGFEYTATQGIVSALARSLPNDTYVPFIQTDVAVNPGNSGGPLFDLDGNVIGVNSQIFSRSGGYMGLSFAIPANVVESVTRQLREKGYVSRGWLGVTIQDVNLALAESFGLDKPAGALVAQVTENSPAAEAGLQIGDVILSYNSQLISLSADLPPMVGNTEVGQAAELIVLRNRERLTLEVIIKELAEDRAVVGESTEPANSRELGLAVAPMTDAQRDAAGVDNGVLVVEADVNGVAASAGIMKDDVLVAFGPTAVTSPAQFADLVTSSDSGDSVAVLVTRNKNPLFIALTMP